MQAKPLQPASLAAGNPANAEGSTVQIGTATKTEEQVRKLFEAAFWNGRPARSTEYRFGVKNGIRGALTRDFAPCPYAPGSAAFDAYYAGLEEGKTTVRIANRNEAA